MEFERSYTFVRTCCEKKCRLRTKSSAGISGSMVPTPSEDPVRLADYCATNSTLLRWVALTGVLSKVPFNVPEILGWYQPQDDKGVLF